MSEIKTKLLNYLLFTSLMVILLLALMIESQLVN